MNSSMVSWDTISSLYKWSTCRQWFDSPAIVRWCSCYRSNVYYPRDRKIFVYCAAGSFKVSRAKECMSFLACASPNARTVYWEVGRNQQERVLVAEVAEDRKRASWQIWYSITNPRHECSRPKGNKKSCRCRGLRNKLSMFHKVSTHATVMLFSECDCIHSSTQDKNIQNV